MTATSHFTGAFEIKLAQVMQKRRNALDKVKDLLKAEYKQEIQEAGIVKLQMSNEGKANDATIALVNGVDPSKFHEGAEVDKITSHLNKEEEAMGGLEHFLGSITSRDHGTFVFYFFLCRQNAHGLGFCRFLFFLPLSLRSVDARFEKACTHKH